VQTMVTETIRNNVDQEWMKNKDDETKNIIN
jgi:hypothetical protein